MWTSFFALGTVRQEGIGDDSLVSESAAAGLFPGQVLVVDGDVKPGARQSLAAHRAGWPATYDRDLAHVHFCGSETRVLDVRRRNAMRSYRGSSGRLAPRRNCGSISSKRCGADVAQRSVRRTVKRAAG